MSEDSKRIVAVLVGVLVAGTLAIAAGSALLRGHGSRRLSYRQATTPARSEPDPTIFATVVGKGTPGLDLTAMFKATPKALAHGKELFDAGCSACHGATGKGDGPAAASLKPPPRNFASPQGWTRGYTLADIYTTLSEGIQGTAMPAFDTMSPADRFALSHYVQSLGKFEHKDDPVEGIKQLDAKYHLSAGNREPNKVAVPIVLKHMAAEYDAPPRLRIPPLSDTGVGAALCRRLIADPVRAALVLSQVPDWRSKLDAFAPVAMAGTPYNGFQSAVATLDKSQWQAFHDELVKRTPVPGPPIRQVALHAER